MYTTGSHLSMSRGESPCFVLSRGPNADQTTEAAAKPVMGCFFPDLYPSSTILIGCGSRIDAVMGR